MNARDDIERGLAFTSIEVDDQTAEDFGDLALELEQALRDAGIDPDDEVAAQAFCAAWMKARTTGGCDGERDLQ